MSTSGHPPQDGPGAAGEDAAATGSPRADLETTGHPSWGPDEALVRRLREEIAAAAAAAAGGTSRAAGGKPAPGGARPAGHAVVPPVSAARWWPLRPRSGRGRSPLDALVALARAVVTGSRTGGRHGEDRR